MVKIKVDLSDLSRLQASLTSGQELGEVTGRLAEMSERQTDVRFSRRREPSGKPWAERKRPAAHPLLELSGDLRKSITAEGDTAGGNDGVELKGPVPYGRIIQSKRPFLGWGKRDQKELAAEAGRLLAGSVLR